MINELTDIVVNAFNDTANVTADAGDDAHWLLFLGMATVVTLGILAACEGYRMWKKRSRRRKDMFRKEETREWCDERDVLYRNEFFYNKADVSERYRYAEMEYVPPQKKLFVYNKNFRFDP